MNRTRRGLALLRASRQVFTINPALAWYPFVALTTFLGAFFFIFTPLAGLGAYLLYSAGILTEANAEQLLSSWPFYVVGALALLFFHLIAVFTNTAFYIAADAALKGEKMPLGKAFAEAWTRRKRLTQWAIIGAGMSLIINFIQERAGWAGRIVGFLGGLAWALATVFVIPTLVTHDVGPVEAIRKSSSLFKKTWGERVTVGFSLGLYFLLAVFSFTIPTGVSAWAAAEGIIPISLAIGIGLITFSIMLMFGAYLTSVQTIFMAALFRYAETGDYVGPFSQEMIAGAYRPKKGILG